MKYLFAIIFVFALVACAPVPSFPAPTPSITQSPNRPTSEPTVQPTNYPTTTPPNNPTATPSQVTLKFWHAQPYANHATLKALVAKFNATHPNIQVSEAYQGNDTDLLKKVRATNAPPDILLAYPDDLAGLIKQDSIASLDDLLAADNQDVFPAFLDRYAQFDNKIFSVAFARNLQVMYYNADLLKLAGASRPPEAWDEFARVCDTLAKIPNTLCYVLNPNALTFTTWVYNRGGEIASADGKTILLAQKPGMDALNVLGDLFKKKQAALVNRALQEPADFAMGKVAFTFDTTNGLAMYERAIKSATKPFAWGIAPSPRTTRDPVILASGSSLAIVKTNATRERAAREFIAWMLTSTPSAEWARATATFPARGSAQTLLADYAKTNVQYGVALTWLKFARSEPNLAAWQTIRINLADAMLAVANGKPATDVLNDAVKKSNDALTR